MFEEALYRLIRTIYSELNIPSGTIGELAELLETEARVILSRIRGPISSDVILFAFDLYYKTNFSGFITPRFISPEEASLLLPSLDMSYAGLLAGLLEQICAIKLEVISKNLTKPKSRKRKPTKPPSVSSIELESSSLPSVIDISSSDDREKIVVALASSPGSTVNERASPESKIVPNLSIEKTVKKRAATSTPEVESSPAPRGPPKKAKTVTIAERRAQDAARDIEKKRNLKGDPEIAPTLEPLDKILEVLKNSKISAQNYLRLKNNDPESESMVRENLQKLEDLATRVEETFELLDEKGKPMKIMRITRSDLGVYEDLKDKTSDKVENFKNQMDMPFQAKNGEPIDEDFDSVLQNKILTRVDRKQRKLQKYMIRSGYIPPKYVVSLFPKAVDLILEYTEDIIEASTDEDPFTSEYESTNKDVSSSSEAEAKSENKTATDDESEAGTDKSYDSD